MTAFTPGGIPARPVNRQFTQGSATVVTVNRSRVQRTAALSSLTPMGADVRLLARAEAAYQRAIQHDTVHQYDINNVLTTEHELWARLTDPLSHQAL